MTSNRRRRSELNIGLLGTIKVLGLGLNFISGVLVARFLGVSVYGVWSQVFVFGSLLSMIVMVGLERIAIREIAGGLESNKSEVLGFKIVAIFTPLVILAILSVILLALRAADLYGQNDGFLVVFVACSQALMSISTAFLAGHDKLVVSQAANALMSPLVPLMTVQILIILSVSPGVAAFALTTASIFSAISIVLLTSSFLGKNGEATVPWIRPTFKLRIWFRSGLLLTVAGTANYLSSVIDFLVVSRSFDDAEIGLYRIATRLANVVLISSSLVIFSVQPQIARYFRNSDSDSIQALLDRASRTTLVLALTIGIFFLVFSRKVLNLIGADFVSAHETLVILVVGKVLIQLFGFGGLLLLYSKNETLMVRSALIGIVSGAILLPTIFNSSIELMALGSTLCGLLVAIYTYVIAKKISGINPTFIRLGKLSK